MESKGAASRSAGDAGDRSCRKWRFRIHGCAFHLTATDPDEPHFVGSLHRQNRRPLICAPRQLQLATGRTRKDVDLEIVVERHQHDWWGDVIGPFPSELAETFAAPSRWDQNGVSKHRQPGTLPVACMACSPSVSIRKQTATWSPQQSATSNEILQVKPPGGNDVVGIRGPECFLPSNRASHIRGLLAFSAAPSSSSRLRHPTR